MKKLLFTAILLLAGLAEAQTYQYTCRSFIRQTELYIKINSATMEVRSGSDSLAVYDNKGLVTAKGVEGAFYYFTLNYEKSRNTSRKTHSDYYHVDSTVLHGGKKYPDGSMGGPMVSDSYQSDFLRCLSN